MSKPYTVVPSFRPMVSEYNNDYYRVIMEHADNMYTVHTGDNMVRILDEFSLPNEIKTKLAMIKAYESRQQQEDPMETIEKLATVYSYSYNLYSWQDIGMYVNTFTDEFNDIGWRCASGASREFYCVVTTVETLDLLRGEPEVKAHVAVQQERR